MAVTIPGLAIKVDGDASGFEKMIAGIKQRLSSTSMTSAITAFSTTFTASMLAFEKAAALGSRALGQFAESADRLGPIADLSDKIAISTQTLMAWGSAAEFSGGSLEAVSRGALKYQTVLGDAVMGNEAAAKAFEKLGLSAAQLAGMSNKQGILAVSDALNNMSDAARRSVGVDIFGKGFNEIDLFIRDIRAAEEQAERLGITLDRSVIAKIEAVDDNSKLVGQQFTAMGDRIKADLAPALNVILKDTQTWLASLKEGGGWMQGLGNLSGKGKAPQDTVNNLRAMAEAASPVGLLKSLITGKGALAELRSGQGVNDNPAAKWFERVKKEEAALNSDSDRKAVGAMIGRQSARLGAMIAGLSRSATDGIKTALEMTGQAPGKPRIAGPEFAGALEAGSAAAYAAAYQRDRQGKTDEDIKKNTEKANSILEKSEKWLGKIAANVGVKLATL